MPVFNNALAGAAGSGGADAYQIERSLRFNSEDSANLSFSPSITNGTTSAHSHWTFSAWVKRTKFGVTNQPIFGAMNGSNREGFIAFNSDDTLRFSETGPSSSSYHVDLHTTQPFRDPSAWYHIVCVYAYNQYTFDKARIYVNGVEVTQYTTKTISGGLYDSSYINTNGANHYIGKYLDYSSNATYGDMYLADAYFVPGYTVPVSTDDANGSVTGIPNAKYLDEFGEFDADTGVWVPKKYEGTYPRDGGWHLDFLDTSALGNDENGSNNWTVHSLSTAAGVGNDSLFDSPTNGTQSDTGAGGEVTGNYCVMSQFDHRGCTIKNGGLEIQTGSSKCGRGTVWADTGKWYFEFDMTQYGNPYVGIAANSFLQHYTPQNAIMANNNGVIYDQEEGNHSTGGYTVRHNAIGSYMCAFDLDNGKIWWGKDGTWYEATTGANNSIALSTVEAGNGAYNFSHHSSFGKLWTIAFGSSTNACTYKINTGQRSWKYPNSVPSGFKALCTTNLADPDILVGEKHFEARTYTGNGGTKTIDGFEFSPDLVWLKHRSAGQHHGLYDTTRGALMRLVSDYPYANTQRANTLTAFNTDGFSLGSASEHNSSAGHIAWAWDGGDLVTNSAYNQSAVWSDGITGSALSGYPATNGFNGDTSTYTYAAANQTTTFTFSPAISGTTFEIFMYGGGGFPAITVNGTDAGSATGAWVNVSSQAGGSLSTIACVGGSSSQSGFTAVRVDGKILVDAGVIPVGSLNTAVYNQTQNWTNNVSSTSNIQSGHEDRLFNGILSGSNADIQSNQGTVGVINFSSAITGSKIEIFTIGNVGQIGINGSNLTVTANQWVDTGVTSLTSVETRHPGAGSIQNPTGIRVDGKILVDSGLSVTNVPTIASTVRANPTAGFSIVKYTGNGVNKSEIAHGLGKEPEFIIGKNLGNTTSWAVYTKTTSPAGWMKLDHSTNYQGSTGKWGNEYPTSNIFHVGNDGEMNQSTKEFIAYCFAPTPGFLATGRYDGHIDGAERPFIATGFRPAFVMIKSYSHSTDWHIFDNSRSPQNAPQVALFPDSDAGESTYGGGSVDFFANGFRLKATSTGLNTNSVDYVYLAFAENPFKIARAR